MAFLAITARAQQRNVLSIPDATVQIGQAMLPIAIENTDEIVGAQFDITLPTGVTAETTATLADRAEGQSVIVRNISATRYRVMMFSSENTPLLGNKGTVLYLHLDIPDTFTPGSQHEVTVDRASLSLVTGENVLTEIKAGNLVVESLPDLTPLAITSDKSTIIPGGKFLVSWQVKNIGGVATGGGWSEQIVLINRRGTVQKLVATVYQTQVLDANETMQRQAEVQLPPLLGLEGDNVRLQVRIVPDKDTGESTSSQGNNAATAAQTLSVQRVLYVEPSPARVVEGSTGRVAVKVSRSGDWSGEQAFNLSATADPRVNIPTSVTIPAGQSGAVAYMSIANNTLLDADSVVIITAVGGSYSAASAELIIEDNEYPNLSVEASKTNITEGETFQLTISVSRVSVLPVEVTLRSENSKRFSFPAAITIPAGQTSVTVDVTAVEDDTPSQDISNAFTASAYHFNKGEAIVILQDNDLPVLELELMPTQVQESDGPLAISAVLRRLTHTDKKINVRLSDDSNGGIYYGNQTLALAKGVEEVHFNLGPLDNATVDGDRTVTITAAVWISSCSCSATGTAAGHVSAQVRILDDDGPALSLTAKQSTVKEGASGTLTVSRNTTDTSSPLTVTLTSDMEDGVTYDHTVTIPVGKRSVDVVIQTSENSVENDSHAIVFTASSQGFSSGTCYIMVTDQTLPDARITSITAEKEEAEVNTRVMLTLKVANVGAASLPASVIVKLYQRGVSGAIATLYTPKALAIGEELTLQREVTMPPSIGTQRYYAVVNESNKVEELSLTNNTSAEAVVQSIAPFGAVLSTDKAIYQRGEKVIVTGKLTGSGTTNATVELYVLNSGSRQVTGVTTDEQGAFVYEWEPYALQSGHFAIGACYPGEGLRTEMATFDIYGIRRTSYGNITCSTLVGEPFSGKISLSNPGNLELNNVRVQLLSKPETLQAEFSSIAKMAGGTTQNIDFTLNSDVLSPGSAWEEVKVRILTDEGPTEDVTLYYHNASPRAVLSTDVSSINTTMLIGEGREYTFYITNTGKGATGNITLGLPSWMRTLTASTIGSLEYGQQAKVVLSMMPTDDMQVNVPRTGHISINCENGNGTAITYSVKPVSDRMGTLVIDVTDEYTFLTEEAPHVAGAHVEVRLPVTNELVGSGETDSNGRYTIEVPSGYYKVSVSATQHDSYANNILVDPGTETDLDVFLSFKAITYSWEVVETEVEDVYDIVTTVTYETRVPKPVVVVDFPKELPYKSQVFNVAVTNKGLISAYNVYVDLPTNRSDATFEALMPLPIDTLKPQMSLFIPVRMTVTSEQEVESQTGITSGGTYYGEAEAESSSSSPAHVKRRSDYKEEEVSPGCWRLTFTVAHDRMECDKKTGKQYKAGTDYVQHTYYYGDCGGGGGGSGSGINTWAYSLPEWRPTTNPNTASPTPPTTPPTQVTHPDDNDNRQEQTRVIDGCTTDCTNSGVNAAIGCALSTLGCFASGGLSNVVNVTSLIMGCKGAVTELTVSSAVDCILSVLGCIPGPAGCAFGLAGCVKGVSDAYDTCNEGQNSVKAANGRHRTKAITKENYSGMSLSAQAQAVAEEKLHYVLGIGDWDNVTGREFEAIHQFCSDRIAAGESLMSADRYQYKPYALAEADFDRFLSRIEASLQKESDPSVQVEDAIDLAQIQSYDSKLDEYDAKAKQMGYEDLIELNDSVTSHFDFLLKRAEKGGSKGVCASITLQIKQTMTMTRQAFRGTLTVFNGHPTGSMENVRLNLEVKDESGQIATAHEFQINAESLDGFTGELSLSDGWSLAGNATGTATILFIPTKYAAPETPQNYSFGGTLTYLDPFTGYEVTRTLAPVTLLVKPSPELDLTYFMQRDVYGDDPLTPEIEPSVPAEFALLINNKGFGDATNVKMVTNQPEIIDNSKGLFIDFEIVSSQVNGADATPSFGQSVTNDFGTIAAHSQLYAQWWLKSSLLGHFTEYDVQSTHVTSYGNENLSLLDRVTIHELIHSLEVNAEGQKMRGFMVNDIDDDADMPDMLYLTNGETEPVSMAYYVTSERLSKTQIKLIVHPDKAGWNYGSIADPTHGLATIQSIVRESDGKEIPLQNFWQTDRTLIDGKDWLYEYRLHFADDFATDATDAYLITIDPVPEVLLAVESLTGMPDDRDIAVEAVKTVNVTFNKTIDPQTFTAEDLTMNVQAEKQDASLIGISTEDNKTFALDLTAVNARCGNGYYTLSVQTAGITDNEGYNGRSGKLAGWVYFQGGLVQLTTSVYPLLSGNIQRVTAAGIKAWRAPASGSELGSAEYGSVVTLTATPAEGYEFTNWTLNGDIVSTDPTYSAQAISDLNIVANFRPKNYNVAVTTEGTGGTVTGTGTGIYEYGTVLTLVAQPDPGYELTGWNVNGQPVAGKERLPLTIGGDTDVKATFRLRYLIGDVNDNGLLTTDDIIYMTRILLGLDDKLPHIYNHEKADFNGDGKITISDVISVIRTKE